MSFGNVTEDCIPKLAELYKNLLQCAKMEGQGVDENKLMEIATYTSGIVAQSEKLLDIISRLKLALILKSAKEKKNLDESNDMQVEPSEPTIN